MPEPLEIDETVLAEEPSHRDDENPPMLMDELNGNSPEEEMREATKVEEQPLLLDEPVEISEKVSLNECVPKDTLVHEPALDEPLKDIVPDDMPEKPSCYAVPNFEVTLIKELISGKDVIDQVDADVMEKDDGDILDKEESGNEEVDVIYVDTLNSDLSEKPNDVIPEDDGIGKDYPGGVVTEEETTVETVIVEKTHSEIAVTEITTTRYPTSPQNISDGPKVPRDTPEDPEASSTDDKDGYVIVPADLVKPEESEKPVVDSAEEFREDRHPLPKDDNTVPSLIITKEPKRQRSSDSDSQSSSSTSSTTDTDDERTESDIGKIVSTDTMPDAPNRPTETVFGIVDINYEQPRKEEIVIIENTDEIVFEIQEIPDNLKRKLEDSGHPEDIPTTGEGVPTTIEDVPTHDDARTVCEKPKKSTASLELDIPVEKTSNDPICEDEGLPRRTCETTVETLIIEKTSTQLSTTITQITATSEGTDETDSEVPVTIVPDDEPTCETLPKVEGMHTL